MSLIERMLKQDAVYWPPAGPGADGQPEYGEPVPIKCRWEDVQELYIGRDKTEKLSNAVVYVSQDVLVDGVLMFGTVEDIEEGTPPNLQPGRQGVIDKFDKVPNLRAKKFLRTAYL